jgi:hypothetical protein
MNDSATQSERLHFRFRTGAEEFAAGACGFVGFLGGLVLVIRTHQTHDVAVTIGEVFGTAALTALTGACAVAGIRRYRHQHWISNDKRLYDEPVNITVSGEFEAGFDVLNTWRQRQEDKNDN